MCSRKNPLIPMAAITGNPTREEVYIMMQKYADAGIQQFLIYPRDGCEVPYMSERWLEICGDIIRTADEFGIDIWLYDEYYCPSGTCHGAVLDENPDYIAKCIVVRDGKCEIIESSRRYTDILNPDAVDCFIKKTHQVYFDRFGEYFGRIIKGIFTDEPAMVYFMSDGSQYPYTKGLEDIYRAEYGRDLFVDILSPTDETRLDFHRLTSKLFRENFVDRIGKWCLEHNILLTGHLMSESDTTGSLRSNGDAINALRGFGLPGMDEIYTRTAIDKAEWLTLGVTQAAVREVGRGGLAEMFALGPTDLPPARVEQMIWLEAMFGIDHYILAVSAADARGNVLKNGWFNPMNYMNPWFEGYPELGSTAIKAASFAVKKVKPEVFVRYPFSLAAKTFDNAEKRSQLNARMYALLRALTRAQYQWQLLREEDAVPDGAEVIGVDDDIAELEKRLPKQIYVLDESGSIADELLLRVYTDGSAVLLDLTDSDKPRHLTVHNGDNNYEILLPGRGHYVLGEEAPHAHNVIRSLSPEFTLSLDRPNTVRCNLRSDKPDFTFTASDRLDGIRLLVRDFCYDGEISIDGIILKPTCDTDALTPGIDSLYRSTEPFTLMPGVHTIHASKPAKSEPFLPSCFICGIFAADVIDGNDVLRVLNTKVGSYRLDNVIPQFSGRVTLEAIVSIPDEPCMLTFDSAELFTRVYIDGIPLGGRLSEFMWEISTEYQGTEARIRIEQYTSIGPILGRACDAVADGEGEKKWTNVRTWFPGRYEKSGVTDFRFVKK